MELDRFLHKIQGVLKCEQGPLGPLDVFKKENEEGLSKIVGSLKKFIEDEDFTPIRKQKLYILLFLNTATEVSNDLKKNRKVAHLVGFFPKLSPDLFIKIVVELNLHQYLYESVQHFCASLSYQVLDICINAISWIDLFEVITIVENILCALFNKIVVTDEKDEYDIHLKDVFQRLLLHYDAEKGGSIKRMSQWKSSKLKHYAGLVMASLLSLLEKCTKIYCKKENLITPNCDLYNIEIDRDPSNISLIAKSESTGRLVTTQQCYEHVVAKCLENVHSITIDVWLFWVEIDLDDIPDTENTLQKQIGEKAYICRETLKEAECLGISSKEASELQSRLQNIALKPQSEEDKSSCLDLAQILENIQNPEKNKEQWLRFLLNNSSFAVERVALEVLKDFINFLDVSNVLKLSKLLFSFIKNNEHCEPQKMFALELIKALDSDSQVEFSKCFIENFGLSEILKTEDFQQVFVEVFNKAINEDDKEKELYPQFLSLTLQSAESVVSRAVGEGITSEVRGHLMCDILGRLQPFCDVSVASGNPLLVDALDKLLIALPDLPEHQQNNYHLFVRELVMRKTLDGEQFIKGCIMRNIHLHLKTKNWTVLAACLETLTGLNDIDCVHNCSASLVMMLQVLQANRWSPSTFNLAAVKVCELAVQTVCDFVEKWFDIGFEEKQLQNLTAVVRQYISPVNRYHLYRLIEDEPTPTDPALHLLYRMHYGIGEWSVLQVSPEERTKLVHSLCYVLPVLTRLEWKELFCVVAPQCSEFVCLFHMITDSLLLCLDSAKGSTDSAVVACLQFAVLNVAEVLKYEVARWTKDDNEYRISVLMKMCQLVSSLPASQQESFGLTLIKVLKQLLPEGSRRKPLTPEEMNSVTASIASIPTANVRQNLAKEFLDMVHR